MKNIFDVVGGSFPIEHLCKYICDKYKLDKYVNYSLNHSCDDNFNFALTSKKGKYFVKIFNLKYNEKFAFDYVERYIPLENKPWVKMLLDNENSKVTKLKIDDERIFYFCVMEFVEGNRLKRVKEEDVSRLVDFMVDVNKLECAVEIRHNPASFIELEESYQNYKELIPSSYLVEIENTIEKMKKIRYRNLKKTYIHNLLIDENILKEEDKIYFVGFGYSGYGYRLLDIISIMNSVIYDGTNLKKVVYLWDKFLTNYKSKCPLSVEESKQFDLLFKADCYAKLIFYKYNYKVCKNKAFKESYKEMKKLLKFLAGKEIKV